MNTKTLSSRTGFLTDILLLLLAGMLLYYGSSWQFSSKYVDAAIYQCYAVAFWHGQDGLNQLPSEQCAFLNDKGMLQSEIQRLHKYHAPAPIISLAERQLSGVRSHTTPREYPILTLLPFSLPLIVPFQFYQQAFACLVLLIVVLLYFLVKHFISTRSAILFLIYAVIAGWSTLTSRFDIFPAACTMFALLLAERKRWTWAYVCIALGTFLKFYPVLLLLPLLLAQQQASQGLWYARQRWLPILVGFVGCTILITLASLLISIPGTMGALSYFQARPLEIETLSGAFIWLGSFVGFPYHYRYAFVSMNVTSALDSIVSLAGTLLLVAGILTLCWLQWRKKIALSMAFLVMIALVLVTGKIFSPQYIIWLLPLLATARQETRPAIVLWTSVMLLTYFIYPVVYNAGSPPPETIFLLSLVRGLLLLGFVIGTLIRSSLAQPPEQQTFIPNTLPTSIAIEP
ncbi:hypothetical protein KSC_008120 [Ktedonobacter sp. SOSP1-52]|uniref:glycosyltransferase 87 family protein n=1 Tax=Ktedonobacter sp. SOSP1-52 TaxID=2778366 RepID=UPI001916BB37|nr:glycosyltransferase 87 family protein [Ktedonobacter sp. SOSP1-52]GHO61920.1 hypothetical protein KSC_008120 [Ktedonobacter sp. SOSP1-52]